MSSRDLVGRPLVPFFDANDNVNDALAADASMRFESLDVDARVWNKELGYFEYPSDQTASSSDSSVSTTTNQRAQSATRRNKSSSSSSSASSSVPIAIQSKQMSPPVDGSTSNGSFGSASRMLLTPAMMLSSSCPDATSVANAHGPVVAPPDVNNTATVTTTRSVSVTRTSTTRNNDDDDERSNTPARRRNKSKATGSTAGSTATKTTAATSKRGSRNRTKESTGDSAGPSVSAVPKAAKTELSGGGKWAWSAFQSSPDPKQLPLPPFLLTSPMPMVPPHASLVPTAADVPLDVAAHADRPPQPTTPPEVCVDTPVDTQHTPVPLPPSVPAAVSREHSMTQDLRRMLNIGGG